MIRNICLIMCALPLSGAIQLTVKTSLPSPQPLGTPIVFSATATDSDAGSFSYSYAIQLGGNPYQLVQDLTQQNTFTWAPSLVESFYHVQVTARNNTTLAAAQISVGYGISSRVTGSTAAVNSTSNPLVALYSAPTCATTSQMRVRFTKSGATTSDVTDLRPCHAGSMNFYVAGMYQQSTYLMHHEVVTNGVSVPGPDLTFVTGTQSSLLPSYVVQVAPTPATDTTDKIILNSHIELSPKPPISATATDLAGNILWYFSPELSASQEGSILTRAMPGGTMFFIMNGVGSQSSTIASSQLLIQVDLSGNKLLETNAQRVSEQLVAAGSDPIDDFSHDAVQLPNGDILVMGSTERLYPPGTQGSTTTVDIVGVMIMVLDKNLQLKWHWNAYDFMDINRTATLNDRCNAGLQGCPPLKLAASANDWLHANSVIYLPSSGDLLMSVRNQDWAIKIDYANGTGSSNVLWRLGPGGDFAISSTDPSPWFSHQHDVGYEQGNENLLSVFDNGNTRKAKNPGKIEYSRGQVLLLDPVNFTATLTVNDSLKSYSPGLGSAQGLSNGDYWFNSGYQNISGANGYSQVYEFTPVGVIDYQIANTNYTYRSFRMVDLYTPPAT